MKNLMVMISLGLILLSCSNEVDLSQDGMRLSEKFMLSDKNVLAKNPYLTQDQNDVPVVSWVEGEDENTILNYARFDFESNTFGEPNSIELTKGLAAHHESMPKIAVKTDGTVYVVFQRKEASASNRFASRLFYSFSKDEKLWSEPRQLHSDTSDGIGRSFFDLSVLPDGEIGAIWLDGKKRSRNGSTLMFSKTKADNTFQNDIEIGQKTCQCCRTDIYVDNNSVINVAFRDIINDSIRDMVHLYSKDNGVTFSEPRRISEDNWIINGCPHTGPSMAFNDEGLHFYWYTEGGGEGVYKTISNDEGVSFQKRSMINPHGRHPQVISAADKTILVWDETFKTDSTYIDRIGIKFENEPNEYISSFENNADHPVLTKLNDKTFLVVWAESIDRKQWISYKIVSK